MWCQSSWLPPLWGQWDSWEQQWGFCLNHFLSSLYSVWLHRSVLGEWVWYWDTIAFPRSTHLAYFQYFEMTFWLKLESTSVNLYWESLTQTKCALVLTNQRDAFCSHKCICSVQWNVQLLPQWGTKDKNQTKVKLLVANNHIQKLKRRKVVIWNLRLRSWFKAGFFLLVAALMKAKNENFWPLTYKEGWPWFLSAWKLTFHGYQNIWH